MPKVTKCFIDFASAKKLDFECKYLGRRPHGAFSLVATRRHTLSLKAHVRDAGQIALAAKSIRRR